MKSQELTLNTLNPGSIRSFLEEHKMVIAAIGGIAAGLALAALLGNEKAKTILRSLGRGVVNSSGKFVSDLGNYRQLIAPFFAKNEVQGL